MTAGWLRGVATAAAAAAKPATAATGARAFIASAF
jgi:hypothetical protein